MTRLFALFTVISLIAVGAMSAHGMAPDRSTAALEATMLAMGATSEDLCLDGSLGHEHDCPLCHKLPEPPRTNAPEGYAPLEIRPHLEIAYALVAGPATRPSDVSARAPPRA